MTSSGQELEVKFYVPDVVRIESRLQSLGAQLMQPRVHEINLRFDTPEGELANSYRVLRLRQDTKARVTYKGPGWVQDGVRARQELEFTVGDFETAKALFEALGYVVVVMYEKYRTTYDIGELHITFDEMPYGNFVEIEGPNGPSIQAVAERLGLEWEARSLDSYIAIFERARLKLGFTFRDLSFENFARVTFSAETLGVRPAITH